VGQTIQQVKKQLNEFWQGMDKKKKIKFGVSSLLIIIGITILIVVVTRPKYELLYENLSLKDTGQITKKLDEMNVKWKTGDKENDILVPSDMKNKIKIELASQGLPKDGYGFIDAFNDSSWTMTDYDKKERMKYALQNELASTISEIDGVESATVYIDEKEDTGYVLEENKQQTTASVFIKKDENKPLSNDKVAAIKNLVAGSINMEPEQVSIIDDSGKLLTEDENSADYSITDQYSIEQNIELRTNESIKKFLENVFGYGNVDIRTSVKLNFDNETTKIVEFKPPIEGNEEGLIRSMEEVEENMAGGNEGGVPGTESNPPEYVMGGNQNNKYKKASKTINYELNEINKEIKKTPGQVESITVAVLINSDSITDGELTEEKKKEISDLIFAATGLDTKQVQISSDEFSTNDAETNGQKKKDSKFNLPILILIAGIIAAGTIGFVMFKKKKKNEKAEELENTIEEKAKDQAEVQELDFEAGKSEMKTQIDKFIEKKPDAVAQLLRTWLNE